MLSKSAQKIQDQLNQKGLQTNVVELPESTRTAQVEHPLPFLVWNQHNYRHKLMEQLLQ